MEPIGFFLIVLSYLSGSVPNAVLVSRWLKGVDIRELGSGNPGAANVWFEIGPGAAVLVWLGDSLKGTLPVLLAATLVPDSLELRVLCGAAAILGHCYSVFLGFGGGKAVATAMGVFLAMTPIPIVGTFCFFLLMTKLSGHVSIGSMSSAVLYPALAVWLFPTPIATLAVISGILILYKHIPNIRRLIRKEEFG